MWVYQKMGTDGAVRREGSQTRYVSPQPAGDLRPGGVSGASPKDAWWRVWGDTGRKAVEGQSRGLTPEPSDKTAVLLGTPLDRQRTSGRTGKPTWLADSHE